jgi:hypothetical protein
VGAKNLHPTFYTYQFVEDVWTSWFSRYLSPYFRSIRTYHSLAFRITR